jgi:PAS domain S-box-containing protein
MSAACSESKFQAIPNRSIQACCAARDFNALQLNTKMRLHSVDSQTFDESVPRYRTGARKTPTQPKLLDNVSRIASWMTNTLNCVPDALLATNACGDVLFMNPRAEELTGWSIEQALRRCSSDVFNLLDESGTRVASPLREAYVEEQEYRSSGCVLSPAAGDKLRIEYTAAPIRTESGEVVGAVVVFREEAAARAGI